MDPSLKPMAWPTAMGSLGAKPDDANSPRIRCHLHDDVFSGFGAVSFCLLPDGVGGFAVDAAISKRVTTRLRYR